MNERSNEKNGVLIKELGIGFDITFGGKCTLLERFEKGHGISGLPNTLELHAYTAIYIYGIAKVSKHTADGVCYLGLYRFLGKYGSNMYM